MAFDQSTGGTGGNGGAGGGPEPAGNGSLGIICPNCNETCPKNPPPPPCPNPYVLLAITVDPYVFGGDEALLAIGNSDGVEYTETFHGYVEEEVDIGVYTVTAKKPGYKPQTRDTPVLGVSPFQCGYLMYFNLTPE